MKLVIRAEKPLALRELIEPLRQVGMMGAAEAEGEKLASPTSATKVPKQTAPQKLTAGAQAAEKLIALARQYRERSPQSTWDEQAWVAEEAALGKMAEYGLLRPMGGQWQVQRLPVPAGLPLAWLELLTGWELQESSEWESAAFSVHAMLWLREVGASPNAGLKGRLDRLGTGEGVAVLVVEEDGPQRDIPLVREQRNHGEEHVDEGMLILQANLDDCSPEWLAHVMEQCLRAGANDVHFLPVTMKKSRPGTLLQVMCYQSAAEALKTVIFTETTTFGIRSYPVDCHRLARRFLTVDTRWGEVAVKLGYHRGVRVQVAPEYAVCARLAEAANVSLKQVYQEAVSLAVEKSHVNLP
ncbi:nickel insertion protein [Brevibacillus sp. GCM10020057]|uniref:nickel insertion protein n=1 Tax=Brevibacillus sp. GCM10020057 TaxID=3317327 RepID=UPI0036388B04